MTDDIRDEMIKALNEHTTSLSDHVSRLIKAAHYAANNVNKLRVRIEKLEANSKRGEG